MILTRDMDQNKHEHHHGIYYHGNNMAYELTSSVATQNIASHLKHNMAYQTYF